MRFPMAGIHLYTSLELPKLAVKLAELLQRPNDDPFKKDIIMVDGKGTSNWLTHGILRDGGMGVQMNAELISSWRIIPWMASVLRQDPPKSRPRDYLAGLPAIIFKILSDNPGEWKTWAGSSETDNGVVLWDLCNRLARHYKDLLRDDAEWIEKASSRNDRWSKLWIEAIAQLRKQHESILFIHEVDVLKELDNQKNLDLIAAAVPGRISVFATGNIPRTHLQIFQKLSTVVDVNILNLQPTQQFHGDLNKYIESIDRDEDTEVKSNAYPLLVACNRFFRLQQNKLLDNIQEQSEEILEKNDSTPDTLLKVLKNGIDEFSSDDSSLKIKADNSLVIHRCHGAMREVEVLRDELLRCFKELKNIKQGDVLILCPEPEVYAPILSGVLSAREPNFTFTTAGIFGVRKSPMASLVKSLLVLASGRVTALDIYGLISSDAARQSTHWTESEYEEIYEWFRNAPFQWGLNLEHRQKFYNLPAESHGVELTEDKLSSDEESSENTEHHVGTLEEFINRLALGTAFGEKVILINDKSIPLEGVEGQQLLGLASQLLTVLDTLREWVDSAHTEEHTLNEWIDNFRKVIQIFKPTEKKLLEEYTELNSALAALEYRASSFNDSLLSLRLFSSIIEEACDFEAGSGQFMTGGVTLAPLRSTSIHPARVVVFLGMNDGAFPKRQSKIGPEVYVSKDSKFKTRSHQALDAREDTSIHTFLLGILAAQDRVIVTFDGYAGAEGKIASAAFPVEILRRVAESYTAKEFSYKTHGLMSHQSPSSNGGKPDEETFDSTTRDIVEALKKDVCPVFAPEPPKKAIDFTLAEWIQFWDSPPRQTLRALGVHIPRDSYIVPVDEPLNTGKSVEISARKWVEKMVKQKVVPDLKLSKHSGFFPPSDVGDGLFEYLHEEVEKGEDIILKALAQECFESDNEQEIIRFEYKPIKTDRFRLFIFKNKDSSETGDIPDYTLAVANLSSETFNEFKHFYKWLCVLPKIAEVEAKTFSKLIVIGLKEMKNNDGEFLPVEAKGMKIEIDTKKIKLTDNWYAKIQELMDKSIDSKSPLMPKTFYTALYGMVKKLNKDETNPKRKAEASDKNLRGEYSSDIRDPRARILIPEKYHFDPINTTAEYLMRNEAFKRSLISSKKTKKKSSADKGEEE
jgi:exodeoxyribonuclease V gamma subunit